VYWINILFNCILLNFGDYMNYFKQNLVALLITGLMISPAQAGIKVEVDCCNLIQPALKGLSNAVDALSRVRVPTISLVNHDNHTITTVYKNIPALAFAAYATAVSGLFAYGAYGCYTESEGSFKERAGITALAAISAGCAFLAGAYAFTPGFLAEQITEYYN
jgi:hypothetical protein